MDSLYNSFIVHGRLGAGSHLHTGAAVPVDPKQEKSLGVQTMKRHWFLFFIALLLGWTTPLRGQETETPLQGLEAVEESFFKLKSEGRYDQALERLADAVAEMVRVRSGAAAPLRAELEARGAVYLELLRGLVNASSRYERAEKILALVPEDAANLSALAQELRMEIAIRRGRPEEAAELRRKLGYLQDWHVIGPFDNERGGGYGTAYGPEKRIDLSDRFDGKERPVSWRKVPVRSHTGYVNLNALFTPHDQCLAYALTFLRTDRAVDAALRLGTDEAFKVFLDGHPVAGLDARRLFHFDQDVIGLHLEPGVHALLLKVCDQTGAWKFAARLTAASGAPLEGVHSIPPPEGFRLEAEPSPLPEVKVDKGARAWFEARAAAGEIRAHLYLGILHLDREYCGENAGEATKHFTAFLEKHPEMVRDQD